MPKYVLVWERNHFSFSTLEKAFYDLTVTGSVDDLCFITNRRAYDKFLAQIASLSKMPSIFIFSEISWYNNNTDSEMDANGFLVAKDLRMSGVLAPITICSMFARDMYKERKESRFKILGRPAHYFIQLPLEFNDTLFEDYVTNRSLTKEGLKHILTHTYSILGRVGLTFHNVNNLLQKYGVIETFHHLFQEVSILIKEERRIEFNQFKADFLEEIHQEIEKADFNPKQKARTLKEQLLDRNFLLEETKTDFYFPKEKEKTYFDWNVLLIDDDKHIINEVQERLEVFGINCISALNEKEAFEKLRLDYIGQLPIDPEVKIKFAQWRISEQLYYPSNSITVVICDLMFFKERNEKNLDGLLEKRKDIEEWQEWQGYDILNEISESHPNLLGMIMLTSDRTYTINQASEQKNKGITVRVKDNMGVGIKGKIGAAKFETFKEEIIEIGNSFRYRRDYLPISEKWQNIPVQLFKTIHKNLVKRIIKIRLVL